MYFEDVDLGERLGRAGWQNVYVPSAVVVHEGGHATRREPRRMLRAHHTSACATCRPVPRPAARAAAPALRAGLGVRMLLSYVSGRVGAGAQLQRTAAELPRNPSRERRR